MSSLYVEITFSLEHYPDYQIKTDVRDDKISDFLTGYLQEIVIGGVMIDEGGTEGRDPYTVKIELDMTTDTYTTTSNTGDDGLTTGIVLLVVAKLHEGQKTMSKIPSKEENPEGLHRRYDVKKIYGGLTGKEIYFVLRIDADGDDPEHLMACQAAARVYAHQIKDHIPKLSHDLHRVLDMEEAALANRMGADGTGREVTESTLLRLGGDPRPLTPKELAKRILEQIRQFGEQTRDLMDEDQRGVFENRLRSIENSAPESMMLHVEQLQEFAAYEFWGNEQIQAIWTGIFINPSESSD